jgi:hypothetical protein
VLLQSLLSIYKGSPRRLSILSARRLGARRWDPGTVQRHMESASLSAISDI